MGDESKIPVTLTKEYIDRATELVAAVAVQLETEFKIARENNLIPIASIARALSRKDL